MRTSTTDQKRPLGDLRAANRQDSIDAPAMVWRRHRRELKKIFFSPPSKCPIDLIGPLANGRILIRLHGASFAEDRPVARRRAAARPRVIGGNASPRSPAFFQRTFPVFKSFSKVYYARIVKSPLISALLGCDLRTAPGVLYVRNGPASHLRRNLRVIYACIYL